MNALSPRNLGWAAGFLEGEGAFQRIRTTPSLQATQVQREPLDRLRAMFGGYIHGPRRGNGANAKPYFMWGLYGARAAGVMMTLYVLLSEKRQAQVAAAIEPWKHSLGTGSHERAKTHCPRGHAYAGENLMTRGAGRKCRECANANRRAARAALSTERRH